MQITASVKRAPAWRTTTDHLRPSELVAVEHPPGSNDGVVIGQVALRMFLVTSKLLRLV